MKRSWRESGVAKGRAVGAGGRRVDRQYEVLQKQDGARGHRGESDQHAQVQSRQRIGEEDRSSRRRDHRGVSRERHAS